MTFGKSLKIWQNFRWKTQFIFFDEEKMSELGMQMFRVSKDLRFPVAFSRVFFSEAKHTVALVGKGITSTRRDFLSLEKGWMR